MQVMRYRNGGYYIHKISGEWKGKVSAWFDHDGVLLDCEQIREPFGASYHVYRGGPMWQEIQKIGLRYKNHPVE